MILRNPKEVQARKGANEEKYLFLSSQRMQLRKIFACLYQNTGSLLRVFFIAFE